MKEWKASEKQAQKMTRDGAISVDLMTGEATRISDREAEQDFSASNDTAGLAGDVAQRVGNHRVRKGEKKKRKEHRNTFREGEAAAGRPSSRLQFTEQERAAPELQKSILRSDTAADRLDAARDAIPKKRVLTKSRIFDGASGKGQTKLIFKETEKPISFNQHTNPVSRPLQEAGAALHRKVREVEQDNSGVQAGHLGERGVEKAVGFGNRRIRSMRANSKLKPWRAASQAEQAAIKANADFMYQKALLENPQLAGSNPISRLWQKKRMQRQYAAAYRAAGSAAQTVQGAAKTAEATAKAAKKTAEETSKTAEETSKAASFVAKHGKGFLVIGGLLLLILLMISGFQSCASIFGVTTSNVIATSYLSEDTEMRAADAFYSGMETELQNELKHFEALHPGYDEYRYYLDNIAHDPHELAAYLSAKYVSYTLDDVRQELNRIFGLQYKLSMVETVETRYRTETEYDPATGESYTVQVPYAYRIATVTLKNNGLVSLAQSELNAEQFEMYQVYRQTLGNMPLLFGGGSTNTSPSMDISGVKFLNGTRPGNQEIVEIAKSQVGNVGGYPYWSWYGFDSRVAWCACFVSWCIDQAGYSEPRFAGCTSGGMAWFSSHGQWADRNYADIAPGDLIFFDWDNSGDADHVGIVIGKDNDYVYTVEGNSGDACKIRSYPLGSSDIRGYGLMNW